ncbi:hypothetical protein G7Y89_g7117 [Cudoniella acicularis]|uniref:Bacteriophage T5 Orf172 DNA-binding domain-containing protein n=1 Tax=Cudoniella acicularis TaxID=354080 RepID=A0A8H4RLR9_9HELO|nr:hypothetical protein G7Y89_g7117 [Cudoniella acicularis]
MSASRTSRKKQRKPSGKQVPVIDLTGDSSGESIGPTPLRPAPYSASTKSSTSTNDSEDVPRIFDDDALEQPPTPNSPFEESADPFEYIVFTEKPCPPDSIADQEPFFRLPRTRPGDPIVQARHRSSRLQVAGALNGSPAVRGRRQHKRSSSSTNTENHAPATSPSRNLSIPSRPRASSGPVSGTKSAQLPDTDESSVPRPEKQEPTPAILLDSADEVLPIHTPHEEASDNEIKSSSSANKIRTDQTKDNPNQDYHVRLVPYGEEKDEEEVKNMIYKFLKGRYRRNKSNNSSIKEMDDEPESGCVYIYAPTDCLEGYVKIGKGKDKWKRLKDWKKCGLKLEEVKDKYKNSFYHYGMVESLVKHELYNCRRQYKDMCKVHNERHEEWFEIDQAKALKCVDKWRRWVLEQKPFDNEGNLTPFWEWRSEKIPSKVSQLSWDSWTNPAVRGYITSEHYGFWVEYWGFCLNGSGLAKNFRAHFRRKDEKFWRRGLFISTLMYLRHWNVYDVALGFIALIIL